MQLKNECLGYTFKVSVPCIDENHLMMKEVYLFLRKYELEILEIKKKKEKTYKKK